MPPVNSPASGQSPASWSFWRSSQPSRRGRATWPQNRGMTTVTKSWRKTRPSVASMAPLAPAPVVFDDAPPAPSTRELLAFLDTYDDGQRPEFPDEVLPASEFPPPPSPSMKEVSLEDDRTGESTL